jgi:hypothetical protein
MKKKITAKMIRLIFTIFCTATLVCNSVYAETTKSSTSVKQADSNKTMTDDEFMKEFMRLDKEIEIKKKKTEELKKLNKTLDEGLNLVNHKK